MAMEHALALRREGEPRSFRKHDTLAVASSSPGMAGARDRSACVLQPCHTHVMAVALITATALVSAHTDALHPAWLSTADAPAVSLRESITSLVINGTTKNFFLGAAATATRSILTTESSLLGSLALVALVLALRGSTISAIDPALRSQVLAFCVSVVCQVLLWPPATGAKRRAVPIPLFEGACLYMPLSTVGRLFIAASTARVLARPWSAEPGIVPCCGGRGPGACAVAKPAGRMLVIATIEVIHMAPVLLGLLGSPTAAWTVLGICLAMQLLATPPFLHPRACLASARRVAGCTGELGVGAVLYGFRVGAVALVVVTMLQQSQADGCPAFDRALASPGLVFPEGIDIAGDPDALARALAPGVLGASAAMAVAFFSIVPAVSMTLQLQSAVAAARARQTRSNLDGLMKAVTYVSHHARGPLNAASLCLAVLSLDSADEAIDAAAAGRPAEPQSRDADVAGRTDGDTTEAPTGEAAAGSSLAAVPPRTVSPAHEAAPPAVTVDTADPPPRSRAPCDPSPRSSAADDTPTSAGSSRQSATRDLRIALEAAKQELDDLLLWQRLSSASTAGRRESWGRFSAPWFDILASRFAERRRVSRVTMLVTGKPPAEPSGRGSGRRLGAAPRHRQTHVVGAASRAFVAATPTHPASASGHFQRRGDGPAPPPDPLPPLDVVELASADVSCATTPATSPAATPSGRRSTFFGRLPLSSAALLPEPAHLWLAHLDHARIHQAAVALVAVGTYAAAAGPAGAAGRSIHVAVHVTRAPVVSGARPQHPRPVTVPPAVRGFVSVEVRHTGRGYTAAQLRADPFEPFGRLIGGDDSLQLSESGLRLAVVRGVAEAMGGEAGIASAGPHCGAHTWIVVPAWLVPASAPGADALCRGFVPAALPPQERLRAGGVAGRRLGSTQSDTDAGEPSPHSGPRRPLSGWSVWIADDDEVIARVTGAVVRRWGAVPKAFPDGADLVAAIEDAVRGQSGAGRGAAGVAGAGAGRAAAAARGSDAGSGPGTGADTPSATGGGVAAPAAAERAEGDATEGDVAAAKGAAARMPSSGPGAADEAPSEAAAQSPPPVPAPSLPDALLVDARMPRLSGVETIPAALAAGRAADPHWAPRVVMITGEADETAAARARAAGAHVVLTKPVAAKELLAALVAEA